MARRKFHDLSRHEQTRMIVAIYLLIAFSFFAIGLYGLTFYWNNTMHAITAKDYEGQINEGSTNTFGLYSDGDKIIIRERVVKADYNGNYTSIAFTSDPDYIFKIRGDHRFLLGKVAVLTMTVKSEVVQIGNQNITHEVIAEMDENGVLESYTITWSFYTDIIFFVLTIGGLLLGFFALWKTSAIQIPKF